MRPFSGLLDNIECPSGLRAGRGRSRAMVFGGLTFVSRGSPRPILAGPAMAEARTLVGSGAANLTVEVEVRSRLCNAVGVVEGGAIGTSL